jgi:hypothetical protein
MTAVCRGVGRLSDLKKKLAAPSNVSAGRLQAPVTTTEQPAAKE